MDVREAAATRFSCWAFLDKPVDQILFCGVAIGYVDSSAPINNWCAPREKVDAFTTFDGF